MPSEAEIGRALDDLATYEEGMRFQALAVIIAKQHWPDLVACERKKDLGADAVAKPTFAAEGVGKVLACSITATIGKIRTDAKKIKDHFPGITKMIFATSAALTNEKTIPGALRGASSWGTPSRVGDGIRFRREARICQTLHQ